MSDVPVTAAVRVLRAQKVPFEPCFCTYEERGGTRRSAAALGVDEHHVIKTLIFRDDAEKPLVVLMHGDSEVSAKRACGYRTGRAFAMQSCSTVAASTYTLLWLDHTRT